MAERPGRLSQGTYGPKTRVAKILELLADQAQADYFVGCVFNNRTRIAEQIVKADVRSETQGDLHRKVEKLGERTRGA